MFSKIVGTIFITVSLSGCSSLFTSSTYTFDLTKYNGQGYSEDCPSIISRKIVTTKALGPQKIWMLSLNCSSKSHEALNRKFNLSVTSKAPSKSEAVGYIFLKNRVNKITSHDLMKYLSSSALSLGGNYAIPIQSHALSEDGVGLYLIYRLITES